MSSCQGRVEAAFTGNDGVIVAECDWAKGENASKFAIYIETEKNGKF